MSQPCRYCGSTDGEHAPLPRDTYLEILKYLRAERDGVSRRIAAGELTGVGAQAYSRTVAEMLRGLDTHKPIFRRRSRRRDEDEEFAGPEPVVSADAAPSPATYYPGDGTKVAVKI